MRSSTKFLLYVMMATMPVAAVLVVLGLTVAHPGAVDVPQVEMAARLDTLFAYLVALAVLMIVVTGLGSFYIARVIAADARDSKRSEQAAKDSEIRLRTILESVPAGILIIDPQTHTIVEANRAATALIGLPEDSVVGCVCQKFVCPADVGKCPVTDLEQSVDNSERTLCRPGGESVPILKTVARVDLGGREMLLESFADLSRVKLLQKELTQSEEKYRTILEEMDEAYYEIDLKGNLTFVNEAACRMYGCTREEMLGTSYKAFTPKEHWGPTIADYVKVVESRSPLLRRPAVGTKKDGTLNYREDSIFPVFDDKGEVVGLRGTARDVTDRVLTERAKGELQRKYRLLAENTSDVVTMMDLDLNVTWLSASSQKLTGYGREEQKSLPLEKQMTPESLQRALDMFAAELANESSGAAAPDRVQELELEIYHKAGHTIWTENRLQFIRDGQGKATGILMQGRDITARKHADEALQKTVDELKRSNDELQQFAYVASHDLQEPLRMVSSYVQLLEKRYSDRLDPDAHDFVNYAVGGARRMQNLINDLLSYSRVGTRGKPFEPTEASEAYEAALSNLEVGIRESGAVIEHGSLPRVTGDEGQLIQVFQNLVGNAIKFHGGKAPHVYVGAERNNGNWVFSVKDNGIGIEPQYFERVFLVFQRLHGSEYPGTGIGLSIARKIVQRHGGSIWLESQPGSGSTFYFTIPAANEGGNN